MVGCKTKMKNKKIIFYAGVIVTTITLIGVVSATSFEKTSKICGCNRIYDVNRDGVIDFQDSDLCWNYVTDDSLHDMHGDLLYDVNMDGRVNFQDAGLIWIHRD